jgi:hypothetical protein
MMKVLNQELIESKWVIRIRKSKDRQHNGQKKKDKLRIMKQYTENKTSGNTNPTKHRGELVCSGRV